MHLLTPILLTFAALSSAIVVPTDLPDGHWTSSIQDDGSVLTTSLSDPTLPPIISSNTEVLTPTKRLARSAKIAKRRVDCWGNNLDRTGVDRSADALTNWAGGGRQFCAKSKPAWTGFKYNGVLVYYCISRPNSCGNLSNADVRNALRQMDGKCRPYEASWFGWDDSSSGEIVGKCLTGTGICA